MFIANQIQNHAYQGFDNKSQTSKWKAFIYILYNKKVEQNVIITKL